jgi:predicted DNA-binding transcriptional regulator AlpA
LRTGIRNAYYCSDSEGRPEVNRRPTNRATTQPRRGLDHDEAAVFVGVSFQTFDRMVSEGRLPKPVELYGEIVWDLVQLDRAVDRLMGLRRNTFD